MKGDQMKGIMFMGMVFPISVIAADLIVTAPLTITSDCNYENASITEDISIENGAKVLVSGKSTAIDARVTLKDSSKFFTSGSSGRLYSFVTIGGGGGFTVDAGGHYGIDNDALSLWIEALELSSSAQSTGDFIDVLELGAGAYADITCFTNSNSKPARYVFNGGILRNSYKNSVGSAVNALEGKTVVFEGVEGNDIVVMPMYNHPNYFFAGTGTFMTRGDCDFVIDGIGDVDADPPRICTVSDQNPFPSSATNNPNRSWFRITPNGSWEWGHSGDTKLQSHAWLRLSANDRLPAGVGTGYIVLDAGSVGAPRLDLNGFSSAINGLIADSRSQVTNYASAVTSTLTFGRYKDGVLSATVSGNIDVVKENSETVLVIKDAVLPQSLTVAGGTVRVEAGETGISSLGRLTVEAGARLEIDGALARYTDIVDHGGTIVCSNGGKLVYCKQTSGTSYIVDAQNKFIAEKVHVAAGELVFSGDTCTDEWVRFRFRSANAGNDTKLEIGRIALSAVTNDMVTGQERHHNESFLNCKLEPCDEPSVVGENVGYTNYKYNASSATHPADLPRGRFLISPDKIFTLRAGNLSQLMPETIFNIGTSYQKSAVTTELMFENLSLNENVTESWVDITFRLNEGNNRAKAYSLYATKWAAAMPDSWIVESSSDGVVWQTIDERKIASPMNDFYTALGTDYAWYNFPHGFRFTSGRLAGASGMIDGVEVRVDSGAVLDCSMVADGQPIGKLEIDAATGAGTLKGVNFNDSGMINIVNWNTESLYDGLSFSLEDSSDVENLEKWIVYKDGQPTKRIVCYRDGRLYLKPKGLSVRVR
jgi:hypothetical protein